MPLKILDTSDLEALLEMVRPLAWQASDRLRQYYRGDIALDIEDKQGGPVTTADRTVDAFLRQNLEAELDPEQFGYLTEETYQPGPAIPQPYQWLIDPLDGTQDFIHHTGDYAIHIALVHQHRPILAVVAWPERQALYTAIVGQGTYRETAQGRQRLSIPPTPPVDVEVNADANILDDLRILVSRTHTSDRLQAFMQELPRPTLIPMGSIGCKIAAICQGEGDVYLGVPSRSAPKDWDLAAPDLILQEAGGQLVYLDQSLPHYNRGDVEHWSGYVAASGNILTALSHRAQAYFG
ncbi:3'(2'),5'-bisphosphate nucleotidase CysQ [Candidatus Synechococcus calcipolaris G9]|uniref:inositol-phosphate phosphatase n=1 Tax=Candidatus Synechococcus calcipolaris G9 TaxID=1497997 RepID=A0ABT6EZX6_9SYNE|nr:3'(2'),5'-bisphosphate nucleotidase CysQ [Candidatus Synechococcus calcipolaris]MDG2991137.1 3'(2'),5'-bisphosphate nucleotidase CysQ [Candidatus Synechococcus calcipolaris G9]